MKMILHLRNLALMAIMMIAVSFNASGTTVVAPNGGENYVAGTNLTVTWSAGDLTLATVVELYKGAVMVVPIYSGTDLLEDGTLIWPIPLATPVGSDYSIIVTVGGVPDESDADFTITPQSINVTTPNTGVSWVRGTTHTIDWTDNVPGNVDIDLFDGSGYTSITTNVAGTSYSWFIPAGQALGANCRIRVSSIADPGIFDESDVNFTIATQTIVVTTPNTAVSWVRGTTHTIDWTDDATENVKIELFDGTNTSTIAASVAGLSYSWPIPAGQTIGSTYKIKVSSVADPSVIDESNVPFAIIPHITVTTPNTAVSWIRGNSYLIDWTDDVPGLVKVELINNATATTTSLATAQAGTSYLWAIPAGFTLGSQYQIKVSSEDDLNIFDLSDVNFTIAPQTIMVTVPSVPGISWNLESLNNITWTNTANVDPVKIELIYPNTFVRELTPSDAASPYEWTIPDTNTMGNTFKIKISSIADPTIFDLSDHYFRIDAATNTYDITVIQPSLGGMTWVIGDSYLISWTDNLASPVKVELVNFGVTPATIYSISASATGSTLAWTIPGGTAVGSLYKIMITSALDNAVIDLSDNYFQISDAPAPGVIVIEQPTVGGLTWLRGSSYLISWTDNVQNNVVNIVLCNAGGGEIATLATGVSGSTWVWTIPALTYPVGNYKIKVVYNSASGISVSTFAIADSPAGAYIDILQPDVSGITWLRNHSYLISWEDNIPGPVDIFYKRTGDPTEVPIASNVVGSTYVWTIPLAIGEFNDYFITIRSDADPTKVGNSLFPFSILDYIPGSFIDVVQPNGGETWTKGNSYYISWDNDFDENVKIELVNDATATTTTIDASVPGSTTVWTIPNTGVYPAGILYKMKISSTENPGLFDLSDAYFTIVDPAAAAPVVYPNPADLSVTVSLADFSEDNYNITLTNRLNMQFVGKTINSAKMKEFNFSTAFLPNGVYFLTIASDKSIVTKKIIIQH
jgi:hypothetical protein